MKTKLGLTLVILSIMTLFCSCSKKPDKFKGKIWSGSIYRTSDNKNLSHVEMEVRNDTMFMYSNALFGRGKDTLVCTEIFNQKDSILKLKNKDSTKEWQLRIKYSITDKSPTITLTGEDFYLTLVQNNYNILTKRMLAFYKNIYVPDDAFMYLSGAYEGEIEMENSFMDLWSMTAGLKFTMKIVFLDDFKAKIFIKSLLVDMFGGIAPTLNSYRVEGNRIIFNGKKLKGGVKGLLVTDNGATLVLQTDKANMVLHKIY